MRKIKLYVAAMINYAEDVLKELSCALSVGHCLVIWDESASENDKTLLMNEIVKAIKAGYKVKFISKKPRFGK